MDTEERVKILLVDDRPENLLALEALLASPGYELISVNSGEAALWYLLEHDCAIILMDVQMPGLDGFETARLVRQSPRTRNVPIIFITAINVEDRYVAKGYEVGAVDYLFKPLDPQALRSKVDVFARLRRANLAIVKQAQQLREHERGERLRALAELELASVRRDQAAQTRYRELVDGISHAIVWAVDPTTLAYSFVSPSARDILGFPLEHWSSETKFLVNHSHPEDRVQVLERLKNLSSGNHETRFEHRMIKANGELAWFDTVVRREQRQDGDDFELRGFSVDVTEAQEAGNALRFLAEAGAELSSSLDYQTTLLKVARMAVQWLADWCTVEVLDQGRDSGRRIVIAHADPAKESLVSRLTHHPAHLTSPYSAHGTLSNGKEDFAPALTADHLARASSDAEYVDLLKELAPQSFMAIPLIARQQVLGAISFFSATSGQRYGVKEHVLAEELARRAAQAIDNALLYQAAQESIQLRDDFMSVASHELRTPLTALQLQVHALTRELSKTNEVAHGGPLPRLEAMGRQVSRLSKLISNLLEVSRITAGKLRLELEEVNLTAVVQEVVAQFDPELRRAESPAISVCQDGPVIGQWDRVCLEQVVTNLVSNAIKYGNQKQITVVVGGDQTTGQLIVRDQGIGIDPKDQERIFGRFERLVPEKQAGGFGLGLWIVRQIVEALGGTISVVSDAGVGTTVTVDLPRSPAIEKTSPHQGQQLVIVEDEPGVQEEVSKPLRAAGL